MKISVITPAYNGEKFIASCIQNVIDQGCNSVEHIIADGGSTDRTIEIVQQHAEKYPHLRWFSEPDQGQSDAMNKALRIAQGEIIGILNIDDLYEPGTLNFVLEKFRSLPSPTLLAGNCWVWDEEQNREWLSRPNQLSVTNLLIGRVYLINPAAYFYHADLHRQVGDFKVDEHYAMDVDFVLKAAMAARLEYVDKTLGRYHIYADTKTAVDRRMQLGEQRRQAYLEAYTQKLPVPQRWMVQGLRSLRSLRIHLHTAQQAKATLPSP